jgi:hypothetical protein
MLTTGDHGIIRVGFAQFNDRKPADEAVHNTCFSCHEPAKTGGLLPLKG